MNIHYSQTLVFKKYCLENHLRTMTNLPFYTGPKDMADPVNQTGQRSKKTLWKKPDSCRDQIFEEKCTLSTIFFSYIFFNAHCIDMEQVQPETSFRWTGKLQQSLQKKFCKHIHQKNTKVICSYAQQQITYEFSAQYLYI